MDAVTVDVDGEGSFTFTPSPASAGASETEAFNPEIPAPEFTEERQQAS